MRHPVSRLCPTAAIRAGQFLVGKHAGVPMPWHELITLGRSYGNAPE
jgi:hypothetical protein